MSIANRVLLGTISAAALVSCGDMQTAKSTPAIRDGVASARPEVVLLRIAFEDKQGACTGTLIAPNAILTAAHCVDMMKGNGSYLAGESITAQFPVVAGNAVTGFRDIPTVAYWHKNRDPLMITGNDIALLRLANAPAGVRPAALASRAPRWGEKITAVGYGTEGCNPPFNQGTGHGVQRQDTYTWGGPVFVTCPGDSGGPHFNPAGEVTALTSGTRPFGNVNPTVARHLADIRRVLAEW